MKKRTKRLARKASPTAARALVGTLLAFACGDPVGPESCASRGAVELAGDACLVYDDGGALDSHRSAIESVVAETLIEVRDLIPVDRVEIRVSAGSSGAIPEIGIGGRAHGGRVVYLTFDPSSPHMASALGTSFVPLLAHELHHSARWATDRTCSVP